MAGSRRVLLLTGDRLGAAMAGPAIRATELARVLAADGHQVTLAAPWVDEPDTAADDGVTRLACWGEALRPVVAEMDVVVAMTGVLFEHAWLAEERSRGVAVVADAYDPVLFEVLAGAPGATDAERTERARDASARMTDPLRFADLVLCATDSQRHLLLGALATLGRLGPDAYADDPMLATSVAIVPFGLPTEPPTPTDPSPLRGPGGPFGSDDLVLLWGGGMWDWLDPVTFVEAVAASEERVKGFVLAGKHPTPSVPAMAMAERARQRAAALGVAGERVVFADDWVPYATRAGYLCDADVGVSLAPGHVEATFAYRTRVLDYLWASLPVLCSAGDDLAALVEREALGVVVPPGDVAACVAGIGRFADADWYARTRSRVAAAAANLTWPTVAGPLRDFCRNPRSPLSDPASTTAPTRPTAASVDPGTLSGRDGLHLVATGLRGTVGALRRRLTGAGTPDTAQGASKGTAQGTSQGTPDDGSRS
jgi:glycosyltransferase involved in cell wall biosynthesis